MPGEREDKNTEKTTAETAAAKACQYAREYIVKGSTWIENNELDQDRFNALGHAVFDLRDYYGKNFPEYYGITGRHIQSFYNSIEKCKKYSLGNCFEMALMALDCIVDGYPDINAEVFHISGGDHVFLVIGRDPGSNPADPLSWGSSAWICDPWANRFYPASEYRSNLRNFYREQGKNFTEKFNPKKHKLSAIKGLNTEQIRTAPAELHRQYIRMTQEILDALESLKTALLEIAGELEKKHGQADGRITVLRRKTDAVSQSIQVIMNSIQEETENREKTGSDNYMKNSRLLERKIAGSAELLRDTAKISEEDKKTLNTHQTKNEIIRFILNFFGIKTDTLSKVEKSVKEANKKIKNIR